MVQKSNAEKDRRKRIGHCYTKRDMKPWKGLSMKERGAFMRVGVKNGITSVDGIRDAYNKFACGGHKFDGTSEPTQWMYRNKNNPNDLISEAAFEEMFNKGDERFKNYEGVRVAVPKQQRDVDHLYKDGRLDEFTVRPDIAYNSDVRNIPAIETTKEPISDEWRKRFARTNAQLSRQAQMTPAEQWANYYNNLANLSYEDRVALANDRKFKRFIGGVAGGVTALPALLPAIGYAGAGIVNNIAAFNPATYVDFIASKLGASTAYNGFGATTIPGMMTNAYLGAEMGYEGYKDLRYNKNKKWYNYPMDVLGIAGGLATGAELGLRSLPEILNTGNRIFDNYFFVNKPNSLTRGNGNNNNLLNMHSNATLVSQPSNYGIGNISVRNAINSRNKINKIIKRNIQLRLDALRKDGYSEELLPTLDEAYEGVMHSLDNPTIVENGRIWESHQNNPNFKKETGTSYDWDTNEILLNFDKDMEETALHGKTFNIDEDYPHSLLHEGEHSLQRNVSNMIQKVNNGNQSPSTTVPQIEDIYTRKEREILWKAFMGIDDRIPMGRSTGSFPGSALEQGATNAQLKLYLEDLGYDLSSIDNIDELPDLITFDENYGNTATSLYDMLKKVKIKDGISDKIDNGYVRAYDNCLSLGLYKYVTDRMSEYSNYSTMLDSEKKSLIIKAAKEYIKLVNDNIKRAILYVGGTTGAAYMLNQVSGNQNDNNQYGIGGYINY